MASVLEWITSKVSLLGTRLTKHPRFEQAAKEAFELNDITGDGMLNNRELHVTLTLFVRTINSKLPVDLKLPTLEETTAMLEEFDADNNSHLDFEEFKELIKAMLSKPKYSVPLQVLKTVAAQMLLIPTVARFAKENVQALKGTPDIMVVPAIQAACTTMGIKF